MTKDTQQLAEELAGEIRRLNRLVFVSSPADEDTLRKLTSVLSKLIYLVETAPDAWSDSTAEAPDPDRDGLAEEIQTRFPDFGYYLSTSPVGNELATAEVDVNDAVDDVLDIYRDLSDVLWYFENSEPELCIWSAKNLFGHWGRHALNLKSYLHRRLYDW